MIVIRLRGGLGNQLFQYAAGRALADHHHTELKLDLYTYSKHHYRRYELDHFNIHASEATRSEVHAFTGSNPLVRYLNKRENYFRCPRVFAQPHYHYYDGFLELPDDIYLSGYWQSERYFSSIADAIRKEITPAVPLDSRNVEWIDKMKHSESVSVHVRRGDYTSSAYQGFFGGLSTDYYHKAFERVKQLRPSASFFFFSDDPEWCRKNLPLEDAEYISHNTGGEAYKDILLMAACKHHIIANSTFSWWGAWLGNAEAITIGPLQWFRTNYLDRKEPVYASRLYNTKDLFPEGWIRM